MGAEAVAGQVEAEPNDLTDEAIDALMREPIAPAYEPLPLAGVWPANYSKITKPGGKDE